MRLQNTLESAEIKKQIRSLRINETNTNGETEKRLTEVASTHQVTMCAHWLI